MIFWKMISYVLVFCSFASLCKETLGFDKYRSIAYLYLEIGVVLTVNNIRHCLRVVFGIS